MSKLNIPESWAESTLEFAGTWGSGGTPLKSKKEFYGGEINWLKTGDLNNGFVVEVPDRITELGLEDIGGRLYPLKTIIMAMYGATIGKLGILDIEVAVNQACACCTTYEQIYYKYLFFWLMAYRKEYIALGQGGAQPNISRSVIYEQPFAMPPRQEQERIVQKIESCFEKIDATEANLKKIETLLEKHRESALAKAFRGELVEQDPNDESISVLLERIREKKEKNLKAKQEFQPIADGEKPYELPNGWEWVKLGEISKQIQYGFTASASKKGTHKFLRITDITTEGVNWNNVPYCTPSKEDAAKLELVVGDILFARTGGTVGKSFLIKEDVKNSVFASYLIKVRLNQKIVLPELLSIYFTSPAYWNFVTGSQRGAAQPNINGTTLSNLFIPLPPIKEQFRLIKEYKHILEKIDLLKNNLKLKSSILVQQKESILQKAFEGRLVPQIPSEGTGHELLAKILAEKEKAIPKAAKTKTAPRKKKK
ncbi:restriction endonuclease subunit S [Pseudobdellovibrio exovorus]|uniref:Type I restriction modification DNA specificity domain-containing protein n=1 Tax=Pseudobdellovibrio exovorus JSS TaxID=1184267 RepID=M4V7M9_9BACT|nr:restriction endonuclease subunit S [Pseudobdellovibrio exovorus]AGH94445.1 hypothetical protein A11Q_225 [Pseudobdellovibrio exovorus JSS]